MHYFKNETFSNNTIELRGLIKAYEFKEASKSKIKTRTEFENNSLAILKDDFQTYFSQTKTDLEILIDETKRISLKNVDNIKDEYNKHSSNFTNFTSNIELEVTDWFSLKKKELDVFNTDSSNKISELTKTYEELLRLKKPADYWKQRSVKLKNEGWIALAILIGLVLFACVTIYWLLWQTPEGMLQSFFKDKASAIKWSIVYVTFISFLAFCIRAISKFMFSSFHLSRDSEEREQLTYVYLAMIKDSAIDEKDRSLIMQSLFSRADTGLLKDDSSPTMPGNIVEKIFAK